VVTDAVRTAQQAGRAPWELVRPVPRPSQGWDVIAARDPSGDAGRDQPRGHSVAGTRGVMTG